MMFYPVKLVIVLLLFVLCKDCIYETKKDTVNIQKKYANVFTDTLKPLLQMDTLAFLSKMKQLANGDKSGRWPPKTVYPGEGAILPYKRIVAYYGNFFSKGMGVLGQYPPKSMLDKLQTEAKAWEKADKETPVVPAIHYIAVTAQPCSVITGKCRLRMPKEQINKAIELAGQVSGIVFLDIQVGQSTLQEEIPLLKKYLQMPQVHLGIDPEFSMKSGQRPGKSIGTFDATDINYATEYLAALVKEFNLPPKILVVHRFTNPMLTNYKQILKHKEVQVVINMDGFGIQQKKANTYYHCIFKEPVEFAGFKIFYKNDVVAGKQIMQPKDVLKLIPQPVYIQYQ